MDLSSPRKLAAVWFADIVGYSTLSSRDEDAALALVGILQDAARDTTSEHGGRVVKFVGDAVLATFESVDGALRAALAVQDRFNAAAIAKDHGSRLRIGLHLGEIAEAADGDVYGDGVNVASRLQTRARPGQVLMSAAAKEMVRGRAGFVFRRVPVWYRLKGLGLTRVFVVADVNAPPPPRTPLPARAIGIGLAAGIAGFFLLMTSVAMRDDGAATDPVAAAAGDDPMTAPGEPLDAEALGEGTSRLNLGMEHYFASEPLEAVEALEPFRRAPLLHHPDAAKALRYLARAQFDAGRPDDARATLERMVHTEPPMALLIPSAEEEALMSLYYEARRIALRDRAPTKPAVEVGTVVLFDLEVVMDSADPNLETLGSTVSNMLASELESAGVPTQYFWGLMVGLRGERAYQQFQAERSAPAEATTHALLGRVAVRGGEVVISTQVYELQSGSLVSTELATGAWPDGFFEVVERVGAAVGADLAASASAP